VHIWLDPGRPDEAQGPPLAPESYGDVMIRIGISRLARSIGLRNLPVATDGQTT
jgi:hypothetical protein